LLLLLQLFLPNYTVQLQYLQRDSGRRVTEKNHLFHTNCRSGRDRGLNSGHLRGRQTSYRLRHPLRLGKKTLASHTLLPLPAVQNKSPPTLFMSRKLVILDSMEGRKESCSGWLRGMRRNPGTQMARVQYPFPASPTINVEKLALFCNPASGGTFSGTAIEIING
jgi:hypothetical protein